MSGHSKWHNIRLKKGAADAKRSQVFTKYANMITLASREGGGDPTMNARLAFAIEQARGVNMPKENIERAIKRGTGELAGSNAIEEVRYEAVGSGGLALMIIAATDNRNRTVADIKNILSKQGASMGGPNSVAWQFTHKGIIRIAHEDCGGRAGDELQLSAISAGAEDVQESGEGITIITAPDRLADVTDALKEEGVHISESELAHLPTNPIELSIEDLEKAETLTDALEEYQDVAAGFSNIR